MDETMEMLGPISQIVHCPLLLYVSCIHDHDLQLNLITSLIKHVSTAGGPEQSDWCDHMPIKLMKSGLGTRLVGAGRSASWLFAPPMKRTRFVIENIPSQVSGALAQQ